jgi:hypothetical protein
MKLRNAHFFRFPTTNTNSQQDQCQLPTRAGNLTIFNFEQDLYTPPTRLLPTADKTISNWFTNKTIANYNKTIANF